MVVVEEGVAGKPNEGERTGWDPISSTHFATHLYCLPICLDERVRSSGTSAGTGVAADIVGKALINALVIISVIALATFGVVALFYFKCTKFLFGYLMLSSAMLLGYTGGFMATVALDVWQASACISLSLSLSLSLSFSFSFPSPKGCNVGRLL